MIFYGSPVHGNAIYGRDKIKGQLWSLCSWPGNFESKPTRETSHLSTSCPLSSSSGPKISLSMMAQTWTLVTLTATAPAGVAATSTKMANLSRNSQGLTIIPQCLLAKRIQPRAGLCILPTLPELSKVCQTPYPNPITASLLSTISPTESQNQDSTIWKSIWKLSHWDQKKE